MRLMLDVARAYPARTTITLFALLLAAYESGPQTMARRQAYVTSMEASEKPRALRISKQELTPA